MKPFIEFGCCGYRMTGNGSFVSLRCPCGQSTFEVIKRNSPMPNPEDEFAPGVPTRADADTTVAPAEPEDLADDPVDSIEDDWQDEEDDEDDDSFDDDIGELDPTDEDDPEADRDIPDDFQL